MGPCSRLFLEHEVVGGFLTLAVFQDHRAQIRFNIVSNYISKNSNKQAGWAWWLTSVIPALRTLKQ
jgi:hypothetical protein